MSKERPSKTRKSLPVSSQIADSLEHVVGENSALVRRGRYEAFRCGVCGEDIGDFLSEYFLGCLLSPDINKPTLTGTCGVNQARTYLRREWRWKRRMVLVEPEGVLSLVETSENPERYVSPSLTPEGHFLLCELQSRLLSALSELTASQQKALYLRLIEGLSFAEIATQTGQTSAAVRVMVRSAQRRLGALLLSSDFPSSEAYEYLSLLEREAI